MSEVRTFYAELTANSSGFTRGVTEADASAKGLEGTVGRVGSATTTHLAGTGVKNAGLLESGFKKVDGAIAGTIKSIAGMATQMAGFGAILGAGGFLVSATKDAIGYNTALAQLKQAQTDAGTSMPTSQLTAAQDAMLKLGIDSVTTTQAITQMTQAHIPASEMMATLQSAADLSAAKNIDLTTSLKDVELAAQGQGRALTDLGITLPVTVAKAGALVAAQAAQSKALDALNAARAKYTSDDPHVAAAQGRYLDATQKVNTIQQEQANHFENLSQVNTTLEQRVAGAAAAAAGADPWTILSAQYKEVAISAGQILLPEMEKLTTWITNHMPDIKAGMATAFHDIANGIQDAGNVIGVVGPPIKDFVGFLYDHKDAVAGVLGALYAEHKAKGLFDYIKAGVSDAGSLLGLLGKIGTKVFGIGSSPSGSGSLGGLGVQHVWVDNMGMGMGGGGGGGEPIPVAPVAAAAGTAGEVTADFAAGSGTVTTFAGLVGVALTDAVTIGVGVGLSNWLTGNIPTQTSAFNRGQGPGLGGQSGLQLPTFYTQEDYASAAGVYGSHGAAPRTAAEAAANRAKAALATISSDPAKEWNDLQTLIHAGLITTQPQVDAFKKNWEAINKASRDTVTRQEDLAKAVGDPAARAAALAVNAGLQKWESDLAAAEKQAVLNANAVASALAQASSPTGAAGTGHGHLSATGQSWPAGTPVRVGEHGPETITFPHGGKITPNLGVPMGGDPGQQSGGFSVTINQLHLNGVQDTASLFDELRKVGLRRGRGQGVPSNLGAYA